MGQISGAQAPTDHGFVTVETIFNQASAVVTRSPLPAYSPLVGDPWEVVIPRGGLGRSVRAEHGGRAGWNHYVNRVAIGLMVGDGLIDTLPLTRVS